MAQRDVITLWPDGPPGPLPDVGPEVEYDAPPGVAAGTRFLRNISVPSLTVYRPAKPNGVGVIVAPGGGWRIHAWSHEGLDVGEFLAARGYTAFILRYRVMGTPADQAVFEAAIASVDARLAAPLPAAHMPREMDKLAGEALPGQASGYLRAREAAAEDGRRAIAVVRERASEWDLRQDAIGMIGFSAGAFLAADIVFDPQGAKLDFVAPIYGGETRGKPVPANAPPMFTAVAQDDRLLFRMVEGLHAAWVDADRPAELHAFTRGGHGFGMIRQNLPVDVWPELFHAWLKNMGFA